MLYTYSQAKDDITKSKKFKHRAYIVFGEEQFLCRRLIGFMRQLATELQFTVTCSFSTEVSPDVIMSDLHSGSLFATPKLLIIHDDANWCGQKVENLAKLLKYKSEDNVLVIHSYEPELGMKTRDQDVKFCAIVECQKQKYIDILKFIHAEAARQNKSIEEEAAKLLIENTDRNLSRISMYLDELVLFSGSKSLIGVRDVEQLVPMHKEYGAFTLAQELVGANVQSSMIVLRRLLLQDERPEGLLGAVSWMFRRLIDAKIMMESGVDARFALSRAGMKYGYDQLVPVLCRTSLSSLKNKHSYISQADTGIKTGLQPEIALTEMVIKISLEK